MKYIFREIVVFEYNPTTKKITQGSIEGVIPAFDFCSMIPEDYKLLGEFFTKAYQHINGENIDLSDIRV